MGGDGCRIGHLVIVYDVRFKTNMVSMVQLIKRLPGIPVFILGLYDTLWRGASLPGCPYTQS